MRHFLKQEKDSFEKRSCITLKLCYITTCRTLKITLAAFAGSPPKLKSVFIARKSIALLLVMWRLKTATTARLTNIIAIQFWIVVSNCKNLHQQEFLRFAQLVMLQTDHFLSRNSLNINDLRHKPRPRVITRWKPTTYNRSDSRTVPTARFFSG